MISMTQLKFIYGFAREKKFLNSLFTEHIISYFQQTVSLCKQGNNMRTFLIFIMIPIIALSGCRQDRKHKNAQLTTADIAVALQMKWWCLKVPAGMETKPLGVGIKNGSEKIKSFGGVSGIKEGVYKVIVWGWDKEFISYTIIGAHVSMTGTLLNPDVPNKNTGVVSTSIPNGQIIVPDQTFYVKGAENVSLTPPVSTGKIGFCFTFANNDALKTK